MFKEPGINQVQITGGFWGERLRTNRQEAIFYQWEQLEHSGCINNFRIAAGRVEGFREGFFFADSDAYKWLDAASRILAVDPNPALAKLVDEFIELIAAVQMPDGYINTYNQIHFPPQRWVNLQQEHEFYCLGHLIEAGVSHHEATGQTRLLEIVQKAANLLVSTFMESSPEFTDGHEEIEIALIRLYRDTHQKDYLELARHFLERRGRIPGYGWKFARQMVSTLGRMRQRDGMRKVYLRSHPEHASFHLPARNPHIVPPFTWLRLVHNLLSGKYTQQNAPLREQTLPVGHAVRYAYLMTAATMLARETGDESLLPTLKQSWLHLVTRRMYVTGGIGSLPLMEGFGRDFELDPEIAYAETCAALGSIFWNHEMALLTGEACYDDLLEWQLYNAASVGIGLDGRSYFYNNPLTCRGGVSRAGWYDVPCCPSNLSRTWAWLGKYIYSTKEDELRIHQYITSDAELEAGARLQIHLESGLPWEGQIRLVLTPAQAHMLTISLRIPAWSGKTELKLNGAPIQPDLSSETENPALVSACGLRPLAGRYISLRRVFQPGDVIELALDMPVCLNRQHARIPGCGGMVAVSRGPVVYCLEQAGQAADIFNACLRPTSPVPFSDNSFGGKAQLLKGSAAGGQPLTWIPYLYWGNGGDSRMTVFVKTAA